MPESCLVDRGAIPSQLLYSLKLPFFGILMMTPSKQSSGISFLSQMAVKSDTSTPAASYGTALNSFVLRMSLQGAFPLLWDLMAVTPSSLVGS